MIPKKKETLTQLRYEINQLWDRVNYLMTEKEEDFICKQKGFCRKCKKADCICGGD
jgi:hypothetical protein